MCVYEREARSKGRVAHATNSLMDLTKRSYYAAASLVCGSRGRQPHKQ